MEFKFRDLVDIDQLQALTDQLYLATGIPSAVITMDGEILTGSGWQRICTDYHRKNPKIEKECIASDVRIHDAIMAGEPYAFYKCPRGLTDGSAPVIIDGQHVANVFTGQLFTEPPTPDVEETFRRQAREFGFDEEGYMAAFREIPVFTEKAYRSALAFLSGLAHLIAQIGLKSLREKESRELSQSAQKNYEYLVEHIPVGITTFLIHPDASFQFDYFSSQAGEIMGLDPEEVLKNPYLPFEITHPDDRKVLEQHIAAQFQTLLPLEWEGRISRNGEMRWIRLEHSGKRTPDGGSVWNGVVIDINERKRAEEEIIEREARLASITANTPETILQVDRNGLITFVNRLVPGLSQEQVIGSSIYNWVPEAQYPILADIFAAAFEDGKSGQYESEGPGPNAESNYYIVRVRPVIVNGITDSAIYTATDITLQKKAENEQQHTIRLLEILNSRLDHYELMNEILRFVKAISGAEAVGIRLREGEDYPYYVTSGFSERFVKAESKLCAVDLQGQILRDEMGNPMMECMCGNIICGRFDPSKDFFTAHGSFVSNHTTALLASTTEEDRQSRTRNRCNAEGYESVALIPLRCGGETYGLLQFNDHQIGRFSQQFIDLIERLSDDIAISLAQRRAESALKASENRYEQLARQSRTVAWEVDANGLYTYVSPIAELVWGYSPEELIGRKHFYDMHPEDGREDFKKAALSVFEIKGSIEDLLNPVKCRDGRVIQVSTSGMPVLNDAGDLLGYRGADTDVTDKVIAQEALRKSEANLKRALKVAQMGIWEWNPNTDEVVYSEDMLDIFGLDANQMGGSLASMLQSVIHPDDRVKVKEAADESMRTGVGLTVDYRVIHPSKGVRWIRAIGEYLYQDGKLTGVIGVNQDITESKNAEKALRQSEVRLKAIVDNTPDHVIMQDADLRYTFVLNPQLGTTVEGMLGKTDVELLPGIEGENLMRVKRDVLESGKSLEFEVSLPSSSGEREYFDGSYVPEIDSSGKTTGLIGYFRNVTENKRAEQLLIEEEFFLKRAQELGKLGSFSLDPASNTVEGSAELFRIFDVDSNMPLFEAFGQAVHPEDGNLIFPLIDRAVKEGIPYATEHRVVHKSGKVFHVFAAGEIIDTPKGKRMVGIVQDITDRKLAEEAERASEITHKGILQTAMDGFWIVDLQTAKIIEVNDSYCRMTGYSHEELCGMMVNDLELNEDPEATRRHLEKVFEQGEDRFESRHRAKDGSVIDVEISVKYQEFQGGQTVCFIKNITEKKERERVNRDMLERFRTIFEGSPLGIALIDSLSGKFYQVNSKYAQIVGSSPEEMLSITWMSITHPDDIRADLDNMARMNAGEIPGFDMEKRYRKIDGSYIWVKLTVVPYPSYLEGQKVHLAMIEDITDRKQAEAALRESEYFFKESQRAGAIGSYRTDFTKGYWTSSEVLDQIFGIDADYDRSVAGWLAIVHPDDRNRMNEYLVEEVIGKGKMFDMEYRIKRVSDGETRWVHGLGEVAYNENGEIISLIGTIRDITEHKGAEQALIASQIKLRTLFEQAADNILVLGLSPEGILTIKDTNESGCLLHGYSREEMIGKPLSLIDPDIDTSQTSERVAKLKLGERVVFEVTHRRKDGTSFPVEVAAKMIEIPREGVLIVSVERDLSEHKKIEEEQQKLREQLLQAQKMESIGRLAGGVAHDFNNMLMAILGNTEMLIDDISPEDPNYWCLKEIQKAGERSADLTRQLLGFARKQTAIPKLIDLNDHIASSQKMLRRLIGEAIELNFRTDATLWKVMADPSQIDQILMNLCVNARDAIGGNGEIEIRTSNVTLENKIIIDEWTAAEGEYVKLTVRDNGKGMDAQTIRHVFEPFFTTKSVGEGTGLGLSVVFGIVKQNGGYITVESEVNKGATFTILLPRFSDEEVEPVAFIPTASLPQGNETILLVEDESTVLNLAKAILERLGYAVFACSEVSQAETVFADNGPAISLLLSDIVMPKMSGPRLLKKLKEKFPGLKAVFMSGYSEDQPELQEAIQEGALFLQKPFTRQSLAEIIRKALG